MWRRTFREEEDDDDDDDDDAGVNKGSRRTQCLLTARTKDSSNVRMNEIHPPLVLLEQLCDANQVSFAPLVPGSRCIGHSAKAIARLTF